MKKDITIVIVGIALVAPLWIGWTLFADWHDRTRDDELVACTADAMQCPDGSWVGRSGPNCKFVCP